MKCHDYLLELLHSEGLACPKCACPVGQVRTHRLDRAPIMQYRCTCGRVFNLFTGTEWQGTHHPCSTIICILQGVAQGKPTLKLAAELGLDRKHLLERRHRLQANADSGCPPEALPDPVVEVDEMYQNAGEKRCTPLRSRRPTATARKQSSRTRDLG